MKRQELGVCLENSIPSFRAGGEVAGPCGGCVAAGRGDLPLDRVSWKLERQSFKERTSGGQPAASGWTKVVFPRGESASEGPPLPSSGEGCMDLTANSAPPRTDASSSPLMGRLGTEARDACPAPSRSSWDSSLACASACGSAVCFLGTQRPSFPSLVPPPGPTVVCMDCP